MLILDTHVLVWLDEGSSQLGKSALKRIDNALAMGELGVATITFWEIAMLVEKGRLSMKAELDIWRTELLSAGLVEIPLQGPSAIRAGQLATFHGDPADRMIVATAIENSAELITADEKILSWNRYHHTIDARL
ncbi:type II toxin-antitoxin system VapC family toxin [Desulfosarcina cetonica]|uniref:type II toxin-antitoxin system VapC family toxin n=1 Tax=Desulfosarcina cetonica TaxID=90730 RepID=UPI0006D28A1C|nr:type II toxin-antitoxin system VapC family toxin [Desulfosarcina cetonica]